MSQSIESRSNFPIGEKNTTASVASYIYEIDE